MKKILASVAAAAAAIVISVSAPAPAQASPSLCWDGYIWKACIQGPGWVDWNPWYWNGHRGHGNKHWNPGHGHWK